VIPIAVPNLAGNEAAYLAQCVAENFVSSVGAFVTRFEQMVAEATGAPGAVATSSGTTALHTALATLGVEHGDLVILQAMTFIGSANAIHQAGARPWLMDVTRQSWTLDPQQLDEALGKKTRRDADGTLRHIDSGARVAAIMPVYTMGTPADMPAIAAVARRYGLPVVADAAAAIGASLDGRPLADMGADISCISFNGNKTVTCGGGGAVVSCDPALLKRARHLSTTARIGLNYDHDVAGFNYRMTNIQAAVGVAQMENLASFLQRKRQIAARYKDRLTRHPLLSAFPDPNYAQGAFWFSGVVLDPAIGDRIPGIIEHLRANDIDARLFWKPMHLQAPYADCPREPLPVTEDVWQRVLVLPCSTSLTEAEQEHVVSAVLSAPALQAERVRSIA
jgi:dTDP-4-amino-4,6-dideoxygalactose transaminase